MEKIKWAIRGSNVGGIFIELHHNGNIDWGAKNIIIEAETIGEVLNSPEYKEISDWADRNFPMGNR